MDQRGILIVNLNSQYYPIIFIPSPSEKGVSSYKLLSRQIMTGSQLYNKQKFIRAQVGLKASQNRHLIWFPLENLLTWPKPKRRISSFRAHCPSTFLLSWLPNDHYTPKATYEVSKKSISEPQDLLSTKCFSCCFSSGLFCLGRRCLHPGENSFYKNFSLESAFRICKEKVLAVIKREINAILSHLSSTDNSNLYF